MIRQTKTDSVSVTLTDRDGTRQLELAAALEALKPPRRYVFELINGPGVIGTVESREPTALTLTVLRYGGRSKKIAVSSIRSVTELVRRTL